VIIFINVEMIFNLRRMVGQMIALVWWLKMIISVSLDQKTIIIEA